MGQARMKKSRSFPVNRSAVSPQDLPLVVLPKPGRDGGGTVMRALWKRRTVRELSERDLSLQMLSNLLWAACGVNRKKGPFGISGRTAASASNSQEIDLYAALQDGIYLYDPFEHTLAPVAAGDLRRLANNPGQAALSAHAPVQLIYVADVDKLAHTAGYQEPGLQNPDIQKSYYFVDTGLMAGNVSLFAASCGLASWFHNCNKPGLAEKLKLRADQRILFAQTVGYPSPKGKSKN